MKALLLCIVLLAVGAQAQTAHRNTKDDPTAKALTTEDTRFNGMSDQFAQVSEEMRKLGDVIQAKENAKQNASVEKTKLKMLEDKLNLILKQRNELQSRIEVLRAQGRAKGQPTSNYDGKRPGRYTTVPTK